MTTATDSALEDRRMRTVVWVVALATVGLIFDGYDLVVYSTVVSTFLLQPLCRFLEHLARIDNCTHANVVSMAHAEVLMPTVFPTTSNSRTATGRHLFTLTGPRDAVSTP